MHENPDRIHELVHLYGDGAFNRRELVARGGFVAMAPELLSRQGGVQSFAEPMQQTAAYNQTTPVLTELLARQKRFGFSVSEGLRE